MKRSALAKSAWALVLVANLVTAGWAVGKEDGQDEKTSRQKALDQVTYDIKYLASDELGGRQPGTPGMDLAEKYIVEQYKKAGLKPVNEDGTYFQPFNVGGNRVLDKNSVSGKLVGPDGNEIELKLGENFNPLQCRKAIDLDTPMVFVGYSIKADEHNYDDFKDIDVEGKVVVMIRREPQQDNPDSVFDGKEVSRYGFIRTKISNARRAKAAGIVLVNDGVSAPSAEKDELASYDQFGSVTNRVPTLHVTRATFDELLKASPMQTGDGTKLGSLEEVEQHIDDTLSPVSQPIADWKIQAKATFDLEQVVANNVIGIIEGEGPNADETIVIGAHHDHLGMGAYGSRAPGRREIHNGADDNATGTAAVMELARRFASRDKKPGRRLVFVCFSAEEMGLLGARHYVENPSFPIEKTVAMINFDMIGWLRDGRLTLFNWNTSPQFAAAVDNANRQFNLNLVKPASGFAGSDHLPFNNRQVPNIFFHTGLTGTYHTPEDDFETINCDGALKVIEYCEAFVEQLCEMEKAPEYGVPKPVRLGAMLEENEEKTAVSIRSVAEGSIAEKAGLLTGDVIKSIGGRDVTRRREVNAAVKRETGKEVEFKLQRGDAEITLKIKLSNK